MDQSKSIEARQRSARERGFSMIELCIVAVIFAIVSAIAILQYRPALRVADADTAMRQVLDQLRQAREYAVANRRYVQVTFPLDANNNPEIQITQKNSITNAAWADVVLSTVHIQTPPTYTVLPAGMPDTPDGFGKASAIEFNGANAGAGGAELIYFQSDGELVDSVTFLPVNGTVFLGGGAGSTAMPPRAVTVVGTTGRVRGWKSTNTGWIQF